MNERDERRMSADALRTRQEVLAVYWKIEADFPTLRAYNDYLEMLEEIVADLCGDDEVVRRTRRQALEEYKKLNPRTRLSRTHTAQTATVSVRVASNLPPPASLEQDMTPQAWKDWSLKGTHERYANPNTTTRAERDAGGYRRLHAWEYAQALTFVPLDKQARSNDDWGVVDG